MEFFEDKNEKDPLQQGTQNETSEEEQQGSQNEPPKLEIQIPDKDSWVNDILDSDGTLNPNGLTSGGIRVYMLLHTVDCFLDSKGMGVGLGNTEQLAKKNISEETNGVWSIHCFVARLIGDFGIFVLLPLCLISYFLIKKVILIFCFSLKNKNLCGMGWSILFLSVMAVYPFISTASSDAQDILPMWLYLGAVIAFLSDHFFNVKAEK